LAFLNEGWKNHHKFNDDVPNWSDLKPKRACRRSLIQTLSTSRWLSHFAFIIFNPLVLSKPVITWHRHRIVPYGWLSAAWWPPLSPLTVGLTYRPCNVAYPIAPDLHCHSAHHSLGMVVGRAGFAADGINRASPRRLNAASGPCWLGPSRLAYHGPFGTILNIVAVLPLRYCRDRAFLSRSSIVVTISLAAALLCR